MKPYYDEGGITIYHGDCRAYLAELPDVDVVVTDQPYGTGWLRGGGAQGEFTRRRETAEWDRFDPTWIDGLSVPIVTFCPWQGVGEVVRRVERPCVLKYRKTNPAPYGEATEPIVAVGPWSAAWEFEAYNGDNSAHPCQKPLEVMVWLVGGTNGVVLDPFMGSGTTLVAAKSLNRRAIGIEIEEKYCEIAAKRLAQGVLALRPPSAPAGETLALDPHE